MGTIDYARVKREHPKHKAALTRAKNSGSPLKVLAAVEKAYDAFDTWGAWPDDWAAWRVAAWDAHFDWLRSEEAEDDEGEINDRFSAALER